MINTKHNVSELREATRLMVGNLPYGVGREEFAQVFAQIAKLEDVYLSQPKAADRKNGGWGIIALAEATARDVLDRTILVRDRVVRVKRARPKTA